MEQTAICMRSLCQGRKKKRNAPVVSKKGRRGPVYKIFDRGYSASKSHWVHESHKKSKTYCNVVEETIRGIQVRKQWLAPNSKKNLHIDNSATSSVDTKLSISGWICLSIYNLSRGNIIIGPVMKSYRWAHVDPLSRINDRTWFEIIVTGDIQLGILIYPRLPRQYPTLLLLIFAWRFAKDASANSPSGLTELSESECSFGKPGGILIISEIGGMVVEGQSGGDEGDWARSAWVPAVCTKSEDKREIMPKAMLEFPIDRRTVSRVRSILRKERVRISCFLEKMKNKDR